MKTLFVLAFTISLCSSGFAPETVGHFKDPVHPGKCVVKNLILSPGEEAKLPNTCKRVLCSNDSWATIQSCSIALPPIGCTYTDYINISAPYSECCRRALVC